MFYIFHPVAITVNMLFCHVRKIGYKPPKLWSALAMTDLAVPRPPEMRTPPMSLLTDAKSNAVLMLSCPTTIDKGKPSCSERAVTSLAAPSWASMAAMRSSGVIVAVCGRMPRAAGALGESHAEAQPATASRRAARAILRRAIF